VSSSSNLARSLAALALLLFATACGGRGAIFVTIDGRGPDGALQVPGDADKVALVVTRSPEGIALLEKDYLLEEGTHRFPLTLALEQGEQTGTRVKLEVRVFLAELERGYGTTTVLITPEEVNEVTLRIDVP
jgi:hypothetical protein